MLHFRTVATANLYAYIWNRISMAPGRQRGVGQKSLIKSLSKQAVIVPARSSFSL